MSKNNIRFTDSHEWIEIEGTRGTVGISEYAQKELGEIIALELPKVGQTILAGEEVAVLESTKAAADVYAPVSGAVVLVNEVLLRNTHVLNDAPESAGWLFQVEVSNLKELEKLLTAAEYKALINP